MLRIPTRYLVANSLNDAIYRLKYTNDSILKITGVILKKIFLKPKAGMVLSYVRKNPQSVKEWLARIEENRQELFEKSRTILR